MSGLRRPAATLATSDVLNRLRAHEAVTDGAYLGDDLEGRDGDVLEAFETLVDDHVAEFGERPQRFSVAPPPRVFRGVTVYDRAERAVAVQVQAAAQDAVDRVVGDQELFCPQLVSRSVRHVRPAGANGPRPASLASCRRVPPHRCRDCAVNWRRASPARRSGSARRPSGRAAGWRAGS